MNSHLSQQPATPLDSMDSRKRSIVFATIAAGGSHVSTAQAMSEAVARNYPGRFDTSVREPMSEFGFNKLDRRHKDGWRRALRNPWTIVWGQRMIDSLPAATVAVHRRMLFEFARRAASEFRRERPDLIVVNHGWLTVALTMAQRRFGMDVPVVTFETSTLNANALWAEPHAERFVVASHVSRDRLVRFGIPSDRIDIVGYPVREAFLCAPGKAQARERLGLEETFTCLVSLGGEGVGSAAEMALSALEQVGDVQVVVITGRNQELRSRLERISHRNARLRILGFVDDMALYLAASDVVIGKTGPATVMETLAVGRPLLAPERFGSAENKMLRLLERNDLGLYTPSREGIAAAVRRFRDDPESLAEVSRRCASLGFTEMSDRLALYLTHYASERKPLQQARGPGLYAGTLSV